MAMLPINPVTENDITKDGNFDPIPEGWYQAKIVSSVQKATKSARETDRAATGKERNDFDIIKDGGDCYLAVRFDIIGPAYQGRVLFSNINIKSKSPKAEEIARSQLASIGMAIGVVPINDDQQIVGHVLQIKVTIEGSQLDGHKNEVKGFKAVEGSRPPAPFPGRPQTQAPATQGYQPPAGSTPPWMKQ